MQNELLQAKKIEKLVLKMVRIVNADTGGSRVYADMLLSMLPNSNHKVNLSYWCYKADRDDFNALLELIKFSNTDAIWIYEEYVREHVEFLKKWIGDKK